MRAVHLVPSAPAGDEAVSSFAAALAGALDALGVPGALLPASRIRREAEALRQALEAALPPETRTAVVLHYVNYAYERRGCPEWLVRGVEGWRNGGPDRRLLTVFHEVYASGPPWRSSFWLSPWQRRLAARLTHASDAVVTSLELYRDLLAAWRARSEIAVLPVFSALGEPEMVPPLAQRAPRLVVLGGSGGRARVYGLARALESSCLALQLSEIVDIGPSLARPPASIGRIPVRALGPLSSEAVGRELVQARAACCAHTPPFLAKSTVFAAYCAHGLLPVCLERGHASPGEPREGQEYWRSSVSAPAERLQSIADQARAWYAGHALAAQAARYRDLLLGAAR